MVILIANTGRVEQRIVTADRVLDDLAGQALVGRIRGEIVAESAGRGFPDATAALRSVPDAFEPADRDLVRSIVRCLDEVLEGEREERVVLAGTGNLARFGADFPRSITPVLEALEEHVVLLKLFGQLGASSLGADAVAVTIGHENRHEGLTSASVVTTGYGSGSELVGGLGVLGPTRMDYPSTMAAVRAVARYVSELLET